MIAMTQPFSNSSLTSNSFSCLSVRIGFFCLRMIHDSMMIHPSHTTEKAQNLVVRFIGENSLILCTVYTVLFEQNFLQYELEFRLCVLTYYVRILYRLLPNPAKHQWPRSRSENIDDSRQTTEEFRRRSAATMHQPTKGYEFGFQQTLIIFS